MLLALPLKYIQNPATCSATTLVQAPQLSTLHQQALTGVPSGSLPLQCFWYSSIVNL